MSKLFSSEDKRILEKTMQIRERIVDNLLTRKLPENEKDILAVTNLLESMDRSVLGKVKIKVKDVENKNMEETKEALKEMIMIMHKKSSEVSLVEDKDVSLPTSVSYEVNKDEKLVGIDEINIKDFTG